MVGNTKTGGDTAVLSLRLPKDLYDRIKRLSTEDARSMNSYIVVTLERATGEGK